MIRIHTLWSREERESFELLRRRRRSASIFMVRGEWSQSPIHQGIHSFWAARATSHLSWVLLSRGFPGRIIAVAEADREVAIEDIVGLMMWKVKEMGGDHIDAVYHSNPDIDLDRVWNVYTCAARELLAEVK